MSDSNGGSVTISVEELIKQARRHVADMRARMLELLRTHQQNGFRFFPRLPHHADHEEIKEPEKVMQLLEVDGVVAFIAPGGERGELAIG